jgi:hypothetical protein
LLACSQSRTEENALKRSNGGAWYNIYVATKGTNTMKALRKLPVAEQLKIRDRMMRDYKARGATPEQLKSWMRAWTNFPKQHKEPTP